jgi:hypothetical protein
VGAVRIFMEGNETAGHYTIFFSEIAKKPKEELKTVETEED